MRNLVGYDWQQLMKWPCLKAYKSCSLLRASWLVQICLAKLRLLQCSRFRKAALCPPLLAKQVGRPPNFYGIFLLRAFWMNSKLALGTNTTSRAFKCSQQVHNVGPWSLVWSSGTSASIDRVAIVSLSSARRGSSSWSMWAKLRRDVKSPSGRRRSGS